MAKNKFEAVILGTNYEALQIAKAYHDKNKSFVIISPFEKPVESLFNNPFRSFFYQDTSKFTNKQTSNLMTFESGKWKDFIGFGSRPPTYYDILEPLLSKTTYDWPEDYNHVVTNLVDNLEANIFARSKINSFNIVDNKITSITVDDSKELFGENFIWCLPPSQLLDYFGHEKLGKKVSQALSKNKSWEVLELNLCHKKKIEGLPSKSVLMATTENAIPYWGFTYENTEGQFCSQWLAFIETESLSSSEETASVLREMKRQIRRACPEAVEKPLFEKIQVSSDAIEIFSKDLFSLGKINGLDNLILGNNNFHSLLHMDAKLAQVNQALGNLNLDFLSDCEENNPS